MARLATNARGPSAGCRARVAAWGALAALLAIVLQGIAPSLHAREHLHGHGLSVAAAGHADVRPPGSATGCSHTHAAHSHHEPAHYADDVHADEGEEHPDHPHDHDHDHDHGPCGLCDLIAAAGFGAVHAATPPTSLQLRLGIAAVADPAQVIVVPNATPAHPRGPPGPIAAA
ncbi:MAG: DUF2946 family protein [Phycisphaerales bacterium]